ncbi:MAG: DnaJ domain-containing protein [Chromatiales bacterium]|nr:DnaJ domain-containing protein [Chromatiales bacterium]
MKAAERLTEFEVFLARSHNPLGTSVLLILAWIAASDGDIDTAERQQLQQISQASGHGPEFERVVRCAGKRDLGALQLACELVRDHFQGDQGLLFLQMAIGVAIADGVLRPGENFILRFLGDLLRIDRGRLDEIFAEATGRSLPEPSDPSSAAFWQEKDRARRQRRDDGASKTSGPNNDSSRLDQNAVHAYATLGLEYGAPIESVKRAYRRLAQVHHPDKFSALGSESVAAATSTFKRIHGAYQYLLDHA